MTSTETDAAAEPHALLTGLAYPESPRWHDERREDTRGGAAIVADLVGERRPDELLTSQLGSWLPAPMIPRVYVWLDEMPLNCAGKIDRRALAKMLDPALPHPDATRNPHVVPFTGAGGTDTGNCPDAC
jgi:hypothetical protein